MTRLFKQFLKEEEGAGMVEYGLLVALIAVALITVTMFLGTSIHGVFADAGNALSGSGSPEPTTEAGTYGDGGGTEPE